MNFHERSSTPQSRLQHWTLDRFSSDRFGNATVPALFRSHHPIHRSRRITGQALSRTRQAGRRVAMRPDPRVQESARRITRSGTRPR